MKLDSLFETPFTLKSKLNTDLWVDNTLKQNYIKNMVQGFEIASNMYLSYIEDGHNLEELKSFIKFIIFF